MIADIVSLICILAGALLSVCAAIGLMRFPDLLSRMHAAAKPQILGLLLILLGAALQNPHWATVSSLIVIVLFQMGTTPVGVHMVGRAGYRTKHLRSSLLFRDDLADAVARAESRERAAAQERAEADEARDLADAQDSVEAQDRAGDQHRAADQDGAEAQDRAVVQDPTADRSRAEPRTDGDGDADGDAGAGARPTAGGSSPAVCLPEGQASEPDERG